MATQTKPRRTSSAPTGRFARGGTTTSGRFARGGTTTSSRRPSLRRRQPEPSGVKKVLSAVSGVIPTAAAKKAAPGSKKGAAGGVALAAAAAGLAYKNRDKLQQLRGKDGNATGSGDTGVDNAVTGPPVTPPV